MMRSFIKFEPDNFTSTHRTPWAGRQIGTRLKGNLNLSLPERIGESWEFSVSEELPSRCALGRFRDVLRADPEHWLSAANRRVWGETSPLLVKYIDASEDLSVQLHCPLGARDLPGDQCGKWEAWLVLCHAQDAGIYLGLAPNVTRARFEQALSNRWDLRPFLRFVPVERGEFYAIPPCTIHALGANLCVLEPQLIVPNKRAASLRLHDWNRRYDAQGCRSVQGEPRRLHIEEALRFIDFEANCAPDLVQKCRITPNFVDQTETLSIVKYPLEPWLHALIVSGSGVAYPNMPDELRFISVLQGTIRLEIGRQSFVLKQGESGVIAASCRQFALHCVDAHVFLTHCLPNRYHECEQRRL